MKDAMQIHELFVQDVTRDIPPVVYFHEQSPEKLSSEVGEYIITGGWPEGHPNHRRVPDGIHEQYVHLLTAIAAELDKPGGPELPNAWISGFYGSGKSIFAKLLGLALDGVALPDGRSVAEALLSRDTSPRASELKYAWSNLRKKVDPVAVVFDVGGAARDNEHVHSVAVRQIQTRLGYSTKSAHVAFGELDLEREGRWSELVTLAESTFGQPWDELKNQPQAQARFSNLMARLHPDIYENDRDWHMRHGGTAVNVLSPEEAVKTVGEMLGFRRPEATLFLVVDEVSQYVLSNKDRVDRLRAFATSLGAGLKGKVWLLALGQQKLDEDADDSFLIWAKDRFPPKLRVHLAATNIRDVVHKRLLQKKPSVEPLLRDMFDTHRADLKLFAYGCESVTPDEFIEVYPMLPGHIDLLLQITSALRTRSARAQGDDQAIRGLLQLLGELFRDQKLAEMPAGSLVTLDQIYEVQHTALDSDVQASMARILAKCKDDASGLMVRAAKAVALLELIQDTVPTDAKLVSQCLFDRVDCGNQVSEIAGALEELRRRNLLGYSEKTGYKLQSSAAEEWERERREIGVSTEVISQLVQTGLKVQLAKPDRPRLQGRSFPWAGLFSDGRWANDAVLVKPHDAAAMCVDFRFVSAKERLETQWVRRSSESALENRLVWVAGDGSQLENLCREMHCTKRMVERYKPRRDSLNAARKLLLTQEENRAEDLLDPMGKAIAATWMSGKMYFRSRVMTPSDQGPTFAIAVHDAATTILKALFPHFIADQVQPAELMQLAEPELSGPSPKFLDGELGILELDSGRYVPSCNGVVPRRIQEHIEELEGLTGASLLADFGGPPYGYTVGVVKACALGLLRSGKLTIQPEGGSEITAVRDAGVRDVFEKDRTFRRASFFPAGKDDIGFQVRARICKFFKKQLDHSMDREDHAIADAVALHFPRLAQQLRGVLAKLNRLPEPPETPPSLSDLDDVLERCVASARQTKPTVKLVKRHLDALRDGVTTLRIYDAELTDEAIAAVGAADSILRHQVAQLKAVDANASNVESAGQRIGEQLKLDKPWRDIAHLDDDLQQARAAYVAERQKLLQWQESQAEVARSRIKSRTGFSTLTSDHAFDVLRPLTEALTDTTPEAVAPVLTALKDPFLLRLHRAQEKANERLDELLSAGEKPLIVRCDLTATTRNREITTLADIDGLVEEIRNRLTPLVKDNKRVRLV